MKFDFKQQAKSYVIGAASGFVATRFGLGAEPAMAVGVAVGGAFDFVYFFVVKMGAGGK